MSIKSRLNRELYGPSVFEVTLGAALSILLGVFLAAGYLIFFTPVRTLRAEPKEGELARNEVIYIEGSKSPARSGQWMRKRQLLLEGQSAEISVVEDELNAWIADGAKPAGADAPAPAFLQPTSVNFRIRDGVMQIGVPASLNAFGYGKDVLFQVRGGFEQRGERVVFVPSESYLGALALHRLPVVESFLASSLARTQSAAEDVAAAWDRVSSAVIDGNTLTLTVR